ncbi:MAG: asparagine synthetase B family protein [Candidatus Hodarchaeota archaeon]
MPGLVGILKRQDSALDIEQLLARMSQIIKYEHWYTIDTFLDKSIGMGRISLGILNPEPQPIFNEDKSLCIMMEGEIYDYRNLKQELISQGHKFLIDNDPEFILHLYEEYGEDLGEKVKDLNGIFLFAIYDNRLRKLIICNDRYGFRPVYYTDTGEKFLFASEMKAILQDSTLDRIVNDVGVSDFFYFGYLLGNKTLITNVELLPPASILTCDSDRTSIIQYWDFFDYPEDAGHSESYYLDSFANLLFKAVERCSNTPNGRIGALLSGGLDSRAVVACIGRKHYPVYTFAFGTGGCDDARFARMVADTLRTNHCFSEIGPKDLIEYAEKAVWLTDGMYNVIDSHGISIMNKVRHYCNIILCGWEGIYIWFNIDQMDELARRYYQTQDDEMLFQLMSLSRPIAKGVCKINFLEQLFSEAYFGKIKDYPKESFAEVRNVLISKLSHELPFKRIDYYNLTQRQRRFSIYGSVIGRSQIESRAPLFDKDVMDFVFRLPPKFRAEDKILFTKGLFKRFPELADVPWQKTGLRLGIPEAIGKIYRRYQRGKLKANRMLNTLGVRPLFKSNKHFTNYDNWMRSNPELKEYILSTLLSKRAMNRGYFNPDFLKKTLYEHMSGKKSYSLDIGLLLTFELFNRIFIEGDNLRGGT